MKHLMIAAAIFFSSMGVCEACVTVNPSTGTYTVDRSGCVDHGGGNRQAPKQKQDNKANKQPSKGKK